jgi:hypothetical protein
MSARRRREYRLDDTEKIAVDPDGTVAVSWWLTTSEASGVPG